MAKSGWYKESARHSLAAKGVPTGRKSVASLPNYFQMQTFTHRGIKINVYTEHRQPDPTIPDSPKYVYTYELENVPMDLQPFVENKMWRSSSSFDGLLGTAQNEINWLFGTAEEFQRHHAKEVK